MGCNNNRRFKKEHNCSEKYMRYTRTGAGFTNLMWRGINNKNGKVTRLCEEQLPALGSAMTAIRRDTCSAGHET